MPRPDRFPKLAWHDEVRRGFDFYYGSGRQDLKPPPQALVVAHYRELAPAQLEIPEASVIPSPVSFREQRLKPAGGSRRGPISISFVSWEADGPAGPQLIASDMRNGLVERVSLPQGVSRQWLSIANNPAVVRKCDLNGDGQRDWVVTDLGSFLPEDHDRGRLVWIPAESEAKGSPVTLLEHVGRIADVGVADFDGDGDEDLVIAEFGWHKTGGIHLLWNDGPSGGGRKFRPEKVDTRPGTIHVSPADLNGDDRLDFVALISQEFEQVVGFLNRPDGFQKQILYAAEDPSYGSSGISLVDFDADGDLDVLYTNGDTFDSYVVKPYHGISWLENRGVFPFSEHRLASMPGVHRALPVDLDGDGDLDIAAAALVPTSLRNSAHANRFDAVIWLERLPAGSFARHVLRAGNPIHACLEAADFDRDGDVDLAAGGFHDTVAEDQASVYLFWNDGAARPD